MNEERIINLSTFLTLVLGKRQLICFMLSCIFFKRKNSRNLFYKKLCEYKSKCDYSNTEKSLTLTQIESLYTVLS